ncbi:MAG: hypothetical protein AAGA17_15070 [Actinomycetota bacterium]
MRIEPLDDADQLSLTSFDVGGDAHRTAVRFAGTGGRFVLSVDEDADEVDRLRTNPHVEIASGDRSGAAIPGAAILAGTARELSGEAATSALDRIRKKAGLSGKAIDAASSLWHRARNSEAAPQVVFEVVLTEAV